MMGMFICNCCNNLRDSDDGCEKDIRGDNELICNDCTSNGANVCDECWKEIEAGQEFIENDNGLWHKDCVKDAGLDLQDRMDAQAKAELHGEV